MGPGAVDTRVRVVVWAKRPDGVAPGDIDSLPTYVRDLRDQLRALYPGRNVRTAFPDGFIVITPDSPPAERELLEFLALDAADRTDGDGLVRDLRVRPDVRSAYAESGPQRLPGLGPGVQQTPQQGPPPAEGGPPMLQAYLDPAPVGIDARWVWANVPSGPHATFVDVELGWDLTHPELAGQNIVQAAGTPSHIASDKAHGASVLGIVVGAGASIRGIDRDAPARVVPARGTDGKLNLSTAIRNAKDGLQKGDVILIEQQVACPCSNHFAPVEVELLNFKAIQSLVQLGFVVVEVAGNGAKDLDQCLGSDLHFTMAHGECDRDSGAIMVAGTSATMPRTAANDTNHGKRVDCFAWGEHIETCDNHLVGSPYTQDFGATSGAAAIVAGAALLLQFAAKSPVGGVALPPLVVRALLSHPDLNTRSTGYPADGFGVMPNLRALTHCVRPDLCPAAKDKT